MIYFIYLIQEVHIFSTFQFFLRINIILLKQGFKPKIHEFNHFVFSMEEAI